MSSDYRKDVLDSFNPLVVSLHTLSPPSAALVEAFCQGNNRARNDITGQKESQTMARVKRQLICIMVTAAVILAAGLFLHFRQAGWPFFVKPRSWAISGCGPSAAASHGMRVFCSSVADPPAAYCQTPVRASATVVMAWRD